MNMLVIPIEDQEKKKKTSDGKILIKKIINENSENIRIIIDNSLFEAFSSLSDCT